MLKIVHLVPGSGGTFYCQNCLRDEALILELRRQGHDVILVPMYLPTFKEGSGIEPDAPVFFGAINTYLKEKLAIFRALPRWFDRVLDSYSLLNWAGSQAGSTRADGLEGMTLSMLRGLDGNQARECERLTEWLATESKPDVIHISNALLLGLVEPIKRKLDVPIFCTLQDEDTWVDQMDESMANTIYNVIAERAKSVDGFIAVSQHYAEKMISRLNLASEKVRVVQVGTPLIAEEESLRPIDPPVLGYLSPLSENLGLGQIIDAFIELKSRHEFRNLKFKAFGGLTKDDRKFLKGQQKKLEKLGFMEDVSLMTEYDPSKKVAFLQSLSLLSVPHIEGEALGVFLVEAMAIGVPVVQPDVGGYGELLREVGGGRLYDPQKPGELVEILSELLNDKVKLDHLGKEARNQITRTHSIEAMAKGILNSYSELAGIGVNPQRP